MWKKDDTTDEPTPPRREPASPAEVRDRSPAKGQRATIGRSIRIRGEVSGDEDLLIQGHVDGTVSLGQHAVTVGSEGEVKADITARLVTVEGQVEGDLTADEQVILRSSARVNGDLTAPRVVLEDGAQFRGGIDMGDTSARDRSRSPGTTGDSRSRDASTPTGSSEKPTASTTSAGSRSSSDLSKKQEMAKSGKGNPG